MRRCCGRTRTSVSLSKNTLESGPKQQFLGVKSVTSTPMTDMDDSRFSGMKRPMSMRTGEEEPRWKKEAK